MNPIMLKHTTITQLKYAIIRGQIWCRPRIFAFSPLRNSNGGAIVDGFESVFGGETVAGAL